MKSPPSILMLEIYVFFLFFLITLARGYQLCWFSKKASIGLICFLYYFPIFYSTDFPLCLCFLFSDLLPLFNLLFFFLFLKGGSWVHWSETSRLFWLKHSLQVLLQIHAVNSDTSFGSKYVLVFLLLSPLTQGLYGSVLVGFRIFGVG